MFNLVSAPIFPLPETNLFGLSFYLIHLFKKRSLDFFLLLFFYICDAMKVLTPICLIVPGSSMGLQTPNNLFTSSSDGAKAPNFAPLTSEAMFRMIEYY